MLPYLHSEIKGTSLLSSSSSSSSLLLLLLLLLPYLSSPSPPPFPLTLLSPPPPPPPPLPLLSFPSSFSPYSPLSSSSPSSPLISSEGLKLGPAVIKPILEYYIGEKKVEPTLFKNATSEIPGTEASVVRNAQETKPATPPPSPSPATPATKPPKSKVFKSSTCLLVLIPVYCVLNTGSSVLCMEHWFQCTVY